MKEFNSIIEDKQRQHLWIHGQPCKCPTPQFRGYSTNFSAHHRHRQVRTFESYDRSDATLLVDETPSVALLLQDGNPATSTAAAKSDRSAGRIEVSLHNTHTPRQNNAKSTHCTDFATLWKIFLDMVRQFPTMIIVFMDALDECTTQRSDFLDALISLPAEVGVRFCVTSRNYSDIQKAFAECLDIRTAEMTPEDDITRYLEDSVEKHEELHSHREEILEKVSRRGAGMFRYVVLIFGELLSSPFVNISKTLESPPATLSEIYKRILVRLDTDTARDIQVGRRRRRILQWVCMAKRPLSAEELAWGCFFDVDAIDEQLDPASYKIQPDKVLAICGPLLEVMGGHVHFTHLSAKEFLLSKPEDLYTQEKTERDRVAGYLVNATHAHISIAMTGGP